MTIWGEGNDLLGMAIENIPHRIRFFIHPLPLAAVFIMALNDHWLKFQFPGLITGKISDFCGIFYLPIFLLAIMATIDEVFSCNRFSIGPGWALGTIAFADFLLILVKLSAPSVRLIENFFANYLFPIQIIQDPTDLVALIVNPITYFHLKTYWTNSKET